MMCWAGGRSRRSEARLRIGTGWIFANALINNASWRHCWRKEKERENFRTADSCLSLLKTKRKQEWERERERDSAETAIRFWWIVRMRSSRLEEDNVRSHLCTWLFSLTKEGRRRENESVIEFFSSYPFEQQQMRSTLEENVKQRHCFERFYSVWR